MLLLGTVTVPEFSPLHYAYTVFFHPNKFYLMFMETQCYIGPRTYLYMASAC